MARPARPVRVHPRRDDGSRQRGLSLGAADGGGAPGAFKLLQETFLYNFGLPIDHYALVNFTDFQTIISWLGGLAVSVDCAIEDWRLIDPTLDPSLEESWEKFILPIGKRTLSPDMALWYGAAANRPAILSGGGGRWTCCARSGSKRARRDCSSS